MKSFLMVLYKTICCIALTALLRDSYALSNEGVETGNTAINGELAASVSENGNGVVLLEEKLFNEKDGKTEDGNEISSTSDPAVLEIIALHSAKPLQFRKNGNMPEILDARLAYGFKGNAPLNAMLGYLPRLEIKRCSTCETPEIDNIVRAFVKGYEGRGIPEGNINYRGRLKMRMVSAHMRSFIERLNPLSDDHMALAFALEGKRITIIFSTQAEDAREIMNGEAILRKAEEAGGRFSIMLITHVGIGIRPDFLDFRNEKVGELLRNVDMVVSTVGRLLQYTDTHLRLDPLGANDFDLLPAIDGILPNEINPITNSHRVVSW